MNLRRENILFLLGGHDLEMLEIKNILEVNGFKNGEKYPDESLLYFDKNLEWGAKWSDYQNIIQDSKYQNFTVYGIELTKDIDLTFNCKIIDHHNALPPEPTSVEQVCTILNIELTRWQKLIAANDYGYKKAMRAAGASEDEILAIRTLDRKAQGITQQMENEAAASINNSTVENSIRIIKTGLNKFSPITDRLNDDKILIYNDYLFCYYGTNAGKIAKAFQSLIESNKAYSGGGENGFFGIKSKVFTTEEIKNKYIPQIINEN